MCGCSLTRGRVCHLQLLLTLDSAVILGSEFRGTRDHILLPLYNRTTAIFNYENDLMFNLSVYFNQFLII
jgi:hypothetical protein